MKRKKHTDEGYFAEKESYEDSIKREKKRAIIFWTVWICMAIYYLVQQWQIDQKYPNIGEKFDQVEAYLKQELNPLVMPGSEYIKSEYTSRKPEVPMMAVRNTYFSDKAWDEIRSWYLQNAPQYGWAFKREYIRGSPSELIFEKGTKNETYGLSIFKSKEDGNQYHIHLSWEGKIHK